MLLEVQQLRTHFNTPDGVIPAVDGVSFSVDQGETVAIVGESGCGKTVTALSLMRLLPVPPAQFVGGSILFEGTDLLVVDAEHMRNLRGNAISMIFQDPMTSLNPVYTIGYQISESLRIHKSELTTQQIEKRIIDLLSAVGLPDPKRQLGSYPHQLSGGMRQRVMIAMALACEPKLLIADEPTTALDVTIQAQILELIRKLQEKLKTAVVLITHDMGVVAEVADKVIVMYAGKPVEKAPTAELIESPKHPYTQGLLDSIPSSDSKKSRRLNAITGSVPSLLELPNGCAFQNRCPIATDRCQHESPQLKPLSPNHEVSCFESEK